VLAFLKKENKTEDKPHGGVATARKKKQEKPEVEPEA
jgi:hypothetical protein